MLTDAEIADIDRRVQRAGSANCWTGTNGSLAADARRLVRHIQEIRPVCEYPADHILQGERELKGRHYLGEEMDEAAILTEDDVADLAHETRKAADIGGSVVPQPETAVRMIPSQAEPWKHVPADLGAFMRQAEKRNREAETSERQGKRGWDFDTASDPRPEPVRPGTDRFLAVLQEIADLHIRKSKDYGVDEDALANIRAGGEAIGVEPWKGCVLRISDKMQRLKSFCRRGECEFDGVEDTLADIAAYAAIALVMYRESAPPPGP